MINNNEVLDTLRQLSPGELPLDIFNEVARLIVLPVIELVVEFHGKILLNKRPEGDTYWPNQYCLPGRIISPEDNVELSEQVERLYDSLNIISSAKPRATFSTVRLLQTKRGTELALIYKVALVDYTSDEKHTFVLKNEIYEIENILPEHKEIIREI